VADTIDPLAGSYAVEALTDAIEAKAQAYIDKIDDMGGMVRAIEAGFPQQEIGDSAFSYQRAIETGDLVVVGVNQFQVKEEMPKNLLRVDPEVERFQREKTTQVKAGRDQGAVDVALAALKAVATDGGNVVPPIFEAVKTYASLGEICDVLRAVYGEYQAGN
jgi:methylmalonyl-CoA mutase N-terminal domain/subunit